MVYSYKWEGPKHSSKESKRKVKSFLVEVRVEEEELEEVLEAIGKQLSGRKREAKVTEIIDDIKQRESYESWGR